MSSFTKPTMKMRRIIALAIAVVMVLLNALTCFAQTGDANELISEENITATLSVTADENSEGAVATYSEDVSDSTTSESGSAAEAESTASEGIYRTDEEIDAIIEELLSRGEYEEGEAIIVAYKDADLDEIIGSVEVLQEANSEVAEAFAEDASKSEIGYEEIVDEDDDVILIPEDGALTNDVNDETADDIKDEIINDEIEFYGDSEADYILDNEYLYEDGYDREAYADMMEEITEEYDDIPEISEDEVMDSVIAYVEKNGISTAELLKALLRNPKVISAEPNYIFNSEEESEDEEENISGDKYENTFEPMLTAASNNVTAIAENTDSAGDISSYQWAYRHYGSTENLFSAKYNGYQIYGSDEGIPGWNTYNDDGNPIPNASGYVAVMDTGIDVNHPDLKNVMADLETILGSDKVNEIGGGKNGINTGTTEGSHNSPKDISDYCSHGTHVAGIIAAEWNNKGISGAASGVKLVGVKASNDNKNNTFSTKAIIEGINYLIKLQKALLDKGKDGIRAVNCSFGGHGSMSAAETLAFYNLGKTGVITVMASGNDGINLDTNVQTSANQYQNPYVIVVDSISITGKKADSSNYGYVTDIFAPGVDIISTVPGESTYSAAYLPEFDLNSSVGYDDFKTTTDQYYASSYTGAIAQNKNYNGKRVGTIVDEDYDGNGKCLQVDVKDLDIVGKSPAFVLSLPIDKNASPKYVGCKCFKNLNKLGVGVQVLMRKTDGSEGGYWSQSFRVKNDQISIELSELTYKNQPAESAGFTLYKTNGRIYLRFLFTNAAKARGDEFVRIDSIGAGNTKVSYGYKSGTSMAAPAASGAVAILYSQAASENKPANVDAASAMALQVIGQTKRSVILPKAGQSSDKEVYSDAQLWRMCSTGGMVHLDSSCKDSYPQITSASISQEDTEYYLTLLGNNFDKIEYSDDPFVYVYVPNEDKQEDVYYGLSTNDYDRYTYIKINVTEEVKNSTIKPGVNYFSLKQTDGNKVTKGFNIDFTAPTYNLFETEYSIAGPTKWSTNEFAEDTDPKESLWISNHNERAMTTANGEAYILTDNCGANLKETKSGYYNFFKTVTKGEESKVERIGCYPGSSDNPTRHLSDVSMTSIGSKIYAFGFSVIDGSNRGNRAIYEYDTSKDGSKWVRLEVVNSSNKYQTLPSGASLVACGENLYLVGKLEYSGNKRTYPKNGNIMELTHSDNNKWIAKVIGSVSFGKKKEEGFSNPKVAAGKEYIYITFGEVRYNYKNDGKYDTKKDFNVIKFNVLNHASSIVTDLTEWIGDNSEFTLAAYNRGGEGDKDKVWLIGCNDLLGYYADTYYIDEECKLKAFNKRAAASYIPRCYGGITAYNNGKNVRMFALGDTYYEKATGSEPAVAQVFLRSTELYDYTALTTSATPDPTLLTSSLTAAVGNGVPEEDEEHKVVITFDLCGGNYEGCSLPIELYYKAGDPLGKLPTPEKPLGSDVTFMGWYTKQAGKAVQHDTEEGEEIIYIDEDSGDIVNEDAIAVGDSEDGSLTTGITVNSGSTLYASWSQSFNYYTVVYHEEDPEAYAQYFDDDDDSWIDDEGDFGNDDQQQDDNEWMDEGYTITKIVSVIASGSQTNVKPEKKTGFFAAFDEDEDQEEIAEDNSTVVHVYYLRDCFAVFYFVANGDPDYDWAYEIIEYEDTALEPKYVFTKPEYVCEGWYTDETCTNKYDIDTPISEDTILYGKWVYTGHYTAPSSNTGSDEYSTYPSYVSTDGKWSVVDGKWQYNGAKGWNAIADKTWDANAREGDYSWFMFDDKGNMLTGWYTDTDGKRYYLNTKEGTDFGAMLSGWVKIGDMYYYFSTRTDENHTKGELIRSQKETPNVPGTILAI